MAVLPIRIMGDPVLHAPAARVDEITDEVRLLVADMFETMDAAPGVGLAGPQVGVPLRIYTYSYADDEGNPWRGVIINQSTAAGVGKDRSHRCFALVR